MSIDFAAMIKDRAVQQKLELDNSAAIDAAAVTAKKAEYEAFLQPLIEVLEAARKAYPLVGSSEVVMRGLHWMPIWPWFQTGKYDGYGVAIVSHYGRAILCKVHPEERRPGRPQSLGTTLESSTDPTELIPTLVDLIAAQLVEQDLIDE